MFQTEDILLYLYFLTKLQEVREIRKLVKHELLVLSFYFPLLFKIGLHSKTGFYPY